MYTLNHVPSALPLPSCTGGDSATVAAILAQTATPGHAGLVPGAAGPYGSVDLDLSDTQFRVGQVPRYTVSDLLRAVPWVRATPPKGSFAGGALEMFVEVDRANAAITDATVYDMASPAITETTAAFAATVQHKVIRIGARAKLLRVDARATRPGTAQNIANAQMQVAVASILRTLDKLIGTTATTPPSFSGLPGLATTKFAVPAAGVESGVRDLVMSVAVNGRGDGEGPDCFFAGQKVTRRLMATPTGQTGLSGWRLDARTNRLVFHYMGIPVYRTATDESTETDAKLYCANLGMTGLQIMHVTGTPETFGIEAIVQPEGTDKSGQIEIFLHCAVALVAWEAGALVELNSINVTAANL